MKLGIAESAVNGLNNIIRETRKKLSIEDSSHFIVSRTSVCDNVFKVYKSLAVNLYYIDKKDNKLILDYRVKTKAPSDKMDAIWNECECKFVEKLMEWLYTEHNKLDLIVWADKAIKQSLDSDKHIDYGEDDCRNIE